MTTTTTMNDSDLSLRSLLRLASPLHKDSSTLSLRQLVPVHFCLLQAVFSDGGEAAGFESLLVDDASIDVSLFDQEEGKQILQQYCDPKKRLLVLQRLLYVFRNDPFHGLARIVLPYLLRNANLGRSDGRSDEELREELLDAVFECPSSSVAESSPWLDECLQRCRDPPGALSVEEPVQIGWWTTTCRVLMRLYRVSVSQENSCSRGTVKVAAACYGKIYQGLELACTTTTRQDTDPVEYLKPITSWILPLLYDGQKSQERDDQSQTNELWRRVWGVYSANSADESRMVVISAILCSILPHVSQLPLPVGNDPDVLSQIPVHQSIMWDFLFASLRQGMDASLVLDTGSAAKQRLNARDQIIRRRGLYILRLVIESSNVPRNSVWNKYLLCAEALEMETEAHLIDQVWDTVAALCIEAASTEPDMTAQNCLPVLTWNWINLLLSRAFFSETPAQRKLTLFRFLNGNTGIRVTNENSTPVPPEEKTPAVIFQPGKKKHHIKAKKVRTSTLAPITFVSSDFVLNVLLPSFDATVQSVGTFINFEEKGRIQKDDLEAKLSKFLICYFQAILSDKEQAKLFLAGVWSPGVVCRLRTKIVVQVFRAVADTLDGSNESERIDVNEIMLENALASLKRLFGTGSVVTVYRESLLADFACTLSRSSVERSIEPKLILGVFSMFPLVVPLKATAAVDPPVDIIQQKPTYGSLQQWLAVQMDSLSWAPTVGAACASAFVAGQLFPRSTDWNPASGSTDTERAVGGAISLLCTLASDLDSSSTASTLLWPAIHKALSNSPRGQPWINADRATRGLILLENGCRLNVLSGMGNGDLIVDRTQQMLPPPPNIDGILENAVQFILSHVAALTSFEGSAATAKLGGGLRSGEPARVSLTFTNLIRQMETLKNAYPSSLAVSRAIDEMLQQSIAALDVTTGHLVSTMALAYAALACGAQPYQPSNSESVELLEPMLTVCRRLLESVFSSAGLTKRDEQTARSVFYYAKWGALSCMLKHVREAPKRNESLELNTLLTDLFDNALDSVRAAPPSALLPLFDCIVVGAKSWLPGAASGVDSDVYVQNLNGIITALFAVIEDSSSNAREASYMLDEVCALLFRPPLLLEELRRLDRDPDSPTPILDAYRNLMRKAGTLRSHISRAVVCRLSVAWLGKPGAGDEAIGMGAIPYREDIFNLLLHKETRQDAESTQRDETTTNGDLAKLELPIGTSDSSVVQGFVLLFLGKIPVVDVSLRVRSDLLHFLIEKLLDEASAKLPKKGTIMITGTPQYSVKMRSWQALCVLSRFVTLSNAQYVCDKTFACFGQTLHGQIRYFMEIFAVQCARAHPEIFGRALAHELRRRDLTLQQVSSLMIVAGNLIVGRYKIDFFRQFESGARTTGLHEILAGVLPWLSSTQGFSRAIAQLLAYDLIPMVISVEEGTTDTVPDSDWYLRSVFWFLNENPDTKRLRKKQAKFFDNYEVDETCTAEGILRLPVDEGSEANPPHMVEAIKRCLEQVYLESHEHDAPNWKHVETILSTAEQEASGVLDDAHGSNSQVSFQRKIIPIDALDLAVDESRLGRLCNATGRSKQQLVVCATLVDKVPNLAGLARTAEIFAADRLVIPDKGVCRMDNFKSISVGAELWIEIEECKEDSLLSWLRRQKDDGYTIVGLEQTSSSSLITSYSFPKKCVILLGKEKEGIPVQYLQAVDTCVEVPQLGILRSLNVHVTAALAIWEYTKQGMMAAEH